MKKQEKVLVFIIIILFFLGFALITRWSPLAGDDWGYAYQARTSNAFSATFHQYLTWSGRVLAEFWGLTIAPHKNVWNLLNPLLFTGILFLLFYHSENQKHPVLCILTGVLLILSVNNTLRMQTYTWIMGTTYVVPLFLFLVYLIFVRKESHEGLKTWETVLSCIICLFLPLYMENAAGMMFLVNLLLCIDSFFIQKKKDKKWILFLICSLIGLAIIGLSPGAHARMTGDNASFYSLTLFQKITANWSSLIHWTYQNHVWMMMFLSFTSILFLLHQKDLHFKGERAVISVVMTAGAVLTFFSDSSLLLSTIIYIFVTIALFDLVTYLPKEKQLFQFLILFAAICANGIMLISPIFDARSSIYTVYLLFLFTLKMQAEIQWKEKKAPDVCCAAMAILCSFFTMNYYGIYSVVHQVTLKRNQQVEYYRLRPDIKDAYLLGYPSGSIHSADVIPGDDFHDQVFKEYNYLSADLNLHFYYPKEYTMETIWQENS